MYTEESYNLGGGLPAQVRAKTLREYEPVRLTASRRAAASGVLARALWDYPNMRYLVPDDESRERFLPSFLDGLVRYCLSYGEVYTTPGLDGVACWMSPGNTKVSGLRVIRSGMMLTLMLATLRLGLAGMSRLVSHTSYMNEVHERLVPGPHWYLGGLGVEPSRQGQGVGGKLLRPVLTRADDEGLPCYLETHDKCNLKFYEKHGFEMVSAGAKPKRGPRVWAMLRAPRG